ncbi:hypothetical protein [Lentilactobacillus kisonensis]|uniref:hypothetical protein n=1 Tax=Lentilactobacillus kisonensis TaxID=481722 RepID=UPI0006D1B85B|nr:hypothetical protein [Lentilactobacillus kisonensis]
MVGLGTCMLVFMVANSHWDVNGTSSFQFGPFGILFLAWLIVFGIIRLGLSKLDQSYHTGEGELSAGDERERKISQRALGWTYRVVFTLLIIELFGVPVMSIGFGSRLVLFRQAVVVVIGSTLIIGFLTYLVGWIYYDITE